MKKHIVFTGGGTAGHVTPNIALIEALLLENNQTENSSAKNITWQIDYIGSEQGVEKKLIAELNIPYHGIKSGKFRRYFSWQNFLDPFFVLYGIVQAFFLLRRLQTDLVFSKGGFVAFPVVFAAWLNRIPVIAHESDLTPGLANRLCFPFVKKICITFAAGKSFFKNPTKVIVTGTPIRKALFNGDRTRGLALCHFSADKPCVLVIGGSLGAGVINQTIRAALPILTRSFQVIHICGKGKMDASLMNQPDYCQFEYVGDELANLFAASDLVISRSGANSVYEILALQKPHVFIPLSAKVSRGDQIHNARYCEKQGVSVVVQEENLTEKTLLQAVQQVQDKQIEIMTNIKKLNIESATAKIVSLLTA